MHRQEVVEVIRLIDSGQTEPYQCSLEDGELYAVKGRNATTPGLIAETVSAELGKRLGLPVPDFCACQVPVDLLENASDANIRSSLGPGVCFASQWVQPTEVFNLAMAKWIGDSLLAQIYVFDHWIENGDRTLTPKGGNVNLLLSLSDEKLVAFDHNLAFSDTHNTNYLEVHVGRTAWNRAKDIVGFRSELQDRMTDLAHDVNTITDQLPFEWIEEAPHMIERISQSLMRVETENFWNELG